MVMPCVTLENKMHCIAKVALFVIIQLAFFTRTSYVSRWTTTSGDFVANQLAGNIVHTVAWILACQICDKGGKNVSKRMTARLKSFRFFNIENIFTRKTTLVCMYSYFITCRLTNISQMKVISE